MLAHLHGGVVAHATLARSMDIGQSTSRRYLDLLTGTFMIRQLPPWFENIGKRLIKSPKVYIRDSGLCHALLEVSSLAALDRHPAVGASWEGFALEQTLTLAGDRDAYFWGTHSGAELDLLLVRGDRRHGIEFKRSDAPAVTKSMHLAREDLKLQSLAVLYPGDRRYRLKEHFDFIPLSQLPGYLTEIGVGTAGTRER